MAYSCLKSIFLFALVLVLTPLTTFALPTDNSLSARNDPATTAPTSQTFSPTKILDARNTTNLVARQYQGGPPQVDSSGQNTCVPTWNIHDCQLRSTQFQTFEVFLTVFDPWCNAVGYTPSANTWFHQSVGVPDWDLTVEVDWDEPSVWWLPPHGKYSYWSFEVNPAYEDYTGCDTCDRISWMVPFQC
ncbi:hypothetical protein BDZ45DRAFT_753779 [Acephala macrosclerotiorum]|nr:hypothetical protein BDZ45DRAFT_753779 [Acephala macrosclerotiorum]